MQRTIPEQMTAAAIDHYGGPEALHAERLTRPKCKPDEVLLRIDSAGVGVWDPSVRAGEWQMGGSGFPKVMGNDGAGEVVEVGARVKHLNPGDRVYAYSMEGGFYAEYAAVKAADVARLPKGLSTEQAGALGADGITALRGLEALQLKAGEKLLIFGASGGIGHLAVQLAKRLGARVFAVASGPDGVKLVRKVGADAAADGKHDAIVHDLERFAPDGFDCALVLANGKGLSVALSRLRQDGRFAFPHGVEPQPEGPDGVAAMGFDGTPSPDAFERLNALIAQGPFHVEVKSYALDDAAQAHRDVEKHHIGKLALRMH